jgi:chemotaxis protein CheZ
MPAPRKVFRIEEMAAARPDAAAAWAEGELRHAEIMQQLQALHALMTAHVAARPVAGHVDALQDLELHRLKRELHLIYEAISRTKLELARLHVSGFRGQKMTRVTSELDAVMGGTEQATQRILSAAENIDQAANTLSAALKGEIEQGLTQDIQDRVIQIFEACNFQDLTGQRITKVTATLRFIEEHVMRMIEIWGGRDAFERFGATAAAAPGGTELVHGPRLEGDGGHASQNDIDMLFG